MVAFIFAAVAAVASVVAAWKAWQTVSLTQQIRNEARLERLAEALTDLIHACEHYPRPQTGEPPGRDDRFDAAGRRPNRPARHG